MNDGEAALAEVLQEAASAHYGFAVTIDDLSRVSAGASREVWAFGAVAADGNRRPLILKRDPPIDSAGISSEEVGHALDRHTEGRLMQLAGAAGVPAPGVLFFLDRAAHGAAGFVTERIEGETLGRRILRDSAYAEARPKLAFQCGQALARIHDIPAHTLPRLHALPPLPHLHHYRDTLDSFGQPQPGFEYGLRWLEERIELAGGRHTLVHGDFRNGNIIVGTEGLRAVLDWEIGHLGDPVCDLGWISVPSWRFGHFDKPVGGFGEREELLAGYQEAGGPAVDPQVVRFWEVFGALRWGIMCMTFGHRHLSGRRRGVEPAAISRRSAETEYDLLRMLD